MCLQRVYVRRDSPPCGIWGVDIFYAPEGVVHHDHVRTNGDGYADLDLMDGQPYHIRCSIPQHFSPVSDTEVNIVACSTEIEFILYSAYPMAHYTHGNQCACEGAGYYWYDDSCHSVLSEPPPTPEECAEMRSYVDCLNRGCYWYGLEQKCRAVPSGPPTHDCSTIYTRAGCVTCNCYWYNGSCHQVPPPITCTNGDQRCLGNDLQECQNNVWITIEPNSSQCGYIPPCECTAWIDAECISETQRRQTRTCTPSGCDEEERVISDASCGVTPPVCTNGETKCIGLDLYKCINNQWQVIDRNAPECEGAVPPCIEGETKCIGTDLYQCIDEHWHIVDRDSPQCGYEPPIPCPIACVALGTPLIDFLGPVRVFRDAFLTKFHIGRKFIYFYYNKITPFISPKILKMRGRKK